MNTQPKTLAEYNAMVIAEGLADGRKRRREFRAYLIATRIIMLALAAFIAWFGQHGWSFTADGAFWHDAARQYITATSGVFAAVWLAGEAVYRWGK